MAELKGKLFLKKETEMVSETFKRREFVLETIEQYPQKIPMQAVQEKTAILDNFAIGQEITVNFNYRGTQSIKDGQETRHFLNLQVWKID